MKTLNLKRLVSKRDILPLIENVVSLLDAPVAITDEAGRVIFGEMNLNSPHKYPVFLSHEILGWVVGSEQSLSLAHLLNYFVNQESEKKALVTETLEKYKEINLLYTISGKISACLDINSIAQVVLEEAQKVIQATSGSLMLINEKTKILEIIAAFGGESQHKLEILPGIGIAGDIILNNRGELINDVHQDSRFVPSEQSLYSLICVPLSTKNKVIGAINISHVEEVNYTAADLKMLTALASQASAAIENAVLHAEKLQEERIKSRLERYLAPQVVKAIIDGRGEIPLQTAKQNIAILFSDIRNFTAKCEELRPEIIVAYLNEYFSHMVEAIFCHEGTINKFVGDMIVSMFGAPTPLKNSEKKSIEAAIEMQTRLKIIPVLWIQENFRTGIGISSGEVVVGNIGSPQHMDYTAIGDQVNIASRLQSIAKGGQILVSRSVYERTKDEFDFQAMGSVKVKGRKTEVEVFEVLY